jgi:hypothetical protein
MQMTLITTRHGISKQRPVEVTKSGRWLKVQHMTFDPATGRETRSSRGDFSSTWHRLEPLGNAVPTP